ncbi:MAG: SIS domain-containing protein [Rhodopseudomonas palustris]|nr:SIS domain-containing protein [Rhodopseudomonas palustris]
MLENIRTYLDQVSSLVASDPPDGIERITGIILGAYRSGNRVFVFGNGGGSATSAHFVCDLAKGTAMPGKPRLKAISLAENMPLITAWANDTDYTNTFGEQLLNLVEPGDVVIGLSGSGMSPNVINAFRVANEAGATSVLLSGLQRRRSGEGGLGIAGGPIGGHAADRGRAPDPRAHHLQVR